MSAAVVQALLLAAAGAVVLSMTVGLTRRGALSLRFGVGWLSLSCVVMLGAAVGALDLVRPAAKFLHLTPTGLVVGGVGAFLLVVSLQLSSALSHLERTSRRLLQETALLEQRVVQLEREARTASAVGAGVDPFQRDALSGGRAEGGDVDRQGGGALRDRDDGARRPAAGSIDPARASDRGIGGQVDA